MSKTNLYKLHATRAGIRSTISMFIKTAEESKEQLNIAQFNLAVEELEMKTKILYELNEKIMSATDAEHIEEEIVSTEKNSFELKVKLMGLRTFQREIAAKNSNVNRNAQNGHCVNDSFAEQTDHGRVAGTQGRMDSGADGSRVEAGSVECDVWSQTEDHQQAVNSQPFAGGSQKVTGNVPFTFNSANYHRLPKLTLPTFDGDVQTWQTFWDSFESTVHHNCNLTDVQKFSYLKGQLEGEAARTIDGFALTNTNYTRAIDLLKERYGQRHKIVHATMQSLIQLPAPSNNLHSIRKFYDHMETKIRALEALGKPQENYGDVLVPIVLDKLPGDIREHLARQHGDDDWLLSDLRCAIFKEINIKEAGASNRPEVELYGSAASLFAGTKEHRDIRKQGEKRHALSCLLCGDQHTVSECRTYPNVQSKLKVVKEKKLCFNCFRKHAVFSCKSKHRCQRCGRKHHTTICQTRNADPQQATRDAAVLYTSTRQSRSGVLLKTAITDVCYKDSISSAAVLFEKVSDVELNSNNQIHYIPHHPVKKDSSTTPIRIVYDCSCRQTPDSPSLNDCLQSTPPVLNELTSILLRFRLHNYEVTTDIDKAFLNVSLHTDDRDVTRFLWLRDPRDPCSDFLTYRFRSVLFGATSSPFILNATILKHLENNQSVPASEILRRDLYVDNVISSFKEDEECVQYYREARNLMSNAGMNLRSWSSNSEKLLGIVERDNVVDTDDVTKVLGLRWDPSKDVLSFSKRDIPTSDDVTKRFILRHSSQIYDPLGLLSPVTVRTKILMQEIWKQKFDWDVPLPNDIQNVWNSFARDLNTATQITFQRQYLSKNTGSGCSDNNNLLVFVDASLMSYGAVAFICNKEESRIIMAKNRVAPLKTLTLPKLELMAALIGARLAEYFQTIFPSADITMWSDSQIVLHWIATQKVLPRFVGNRVKEIRELTQNYKWKYCPTADNPADLLTRGITADNFMKNDLWMTGPEWLCNKIRWPMWEFSETLHVQIMLEEHVCSQLVVTDQTDRSTADENIQNVINVQNYSKLYKLLRITGYVCRFIQNCRLGRSKAKREPLTATELEQAELLWIRSCQAAYYNEEIQQLKTNKPKASSIKQLRLFLDNTGTIRCSGRIHNAAVDDVTKSSYLLPKKHTLQRWWFKQLTNYKVILA